MAKRMTHRTPGGGSVRPLAAVIAVVTTGVLPVFLTGAMGVQVRRDLGFGEGGLGLVVGAFFIGGTAASAALGRVSERLGPTLSMRLSATLSATVLLAIAVLADSYVTLLLMLSVGGVANALTQPAANLFIARTVDRTRLGVAFAVKQAAVPAATVLGGLAVPTIALTVGWRWAFVLGAVLSLAGAASVPAIDSGPASGDSGGRVERSALRILLVLSAGIGLGAAAAGTLGAFLVSAAVEAGIDEGPAGLLVAVGSAIGIAVRLVAGYRADRRGGGHLRVVAIMLLLGAAAYLLYATGSALVILLATPLAFGAGWGWPGLFNLAVVRQNPDAPGAASGITQTGTYFGAFAGPLLFGWVAEQTSYAAAWLVAAACCLGASVFVVAGRRMIGRARVAAERAVVDDVAPEGI